MDLFSSQINPGAGVCEQSCNWKSGPAWNGRRGLIRMKSKKSRATMALWCPKEDRRRNESPWETMEASTQAWRPHSDSQTACLVAAKGDAQVRISRASLEKESERLPLSLGSNITIYLVGLGVCMYYFSWIILVHVSCAHVSLVNEASCFFIFIILLFLGYSLSLSLF